MDAAEYRTRTINYAQMEPEYDMEFARYGPNTIELPLSPPETPPPRAEDIPFRQPSPFSETSSMTSVDSTESVGTLIVSSVRASFTIDLYIQTITEKREAGCSRTWWVHSLKHPVVSPKNTS